MAGETLRIREKSFALDYFGGVLSRLPPEGLPGSLFGASRLCLDLCSPPPLRLDFHHVMRSYLLYLTNQSRSESEGWSSKPVTALTAEITLNLYTAFAILIVPLAAAMWAVNDFVFQWFCLLAKHAQRKGELASDISAPEGVQIPPLHQTK